MHESRAQVEAAPHSARVCIGTAVRGVLQLQDLEELLHTLFDERVGHVVEPPDQPEVLAAGQFAIDPDGLTRVPDDAPDVRPLAVDIESRDTDGAARLR